MTDNPETDVIDRIDALVNEQLQQESSGYDHNINQPRCRCGRQWHGLPTHGCPGTNFQGPQQFVHQVAIDASAIAHDVDQIFRVGGALAEQIATALRSMADAIAVTAGEVVVMLQRFLPGDPAPEQPLTVQRRALPRPSTTPPMWAVTPERSRRRRRG